MNNIIAVLFALSMMAASEMPQSLAFVTPISRQSISNPLQLYAQKNSDDNNFTSMINGVTQQRREFILKSLGVTSIISSSFISNANAGDDDYLYKRSENGDLTTELFNEDGSLRDPNSVVSAQDKLLNVPFSLTTSANGISMNISTDGGLASPSTSDAKTTMIASYKLPVKWNQDETSQLPLYYDSSEGKNGPSCNRISIYSVSAPSNLDMKTLEKASTIGVGKSLFMDQLPNNYFDKGVLKADLISGRTVRKPIKSLEVEGGVDELDINRLSDLIELKYKTIHDGQKALGDADSIKSTFIEFQKHLY